MNLSLKASATCVSKNVYRIHNMNIHNYTHILYICISTMRYTYIYIYKWTVYICIQYTKMYNICIHIYDPSVKNARFTRSYPRKHTHPIGWWVGMPRDSTVKNSLSWHDNRWTTTTTHSRHSSTQLPSGIWKFRFHLPDPTEVFFAIFQMLENSTRRCGKT